MSRIRSSRRWSRSLWQETKTAVEPLESRRLLSITVTTLASFDGTDGSGPSGGLTLSGGNLYGETNYGGPNYSGTIYSIPVTGGTPTDLASFGGSVTGSPYGGLTISGNTLYGTANYMETYGNASYIFSLPTAGGTPSVVAGIGDSGGDDARPLILDGTLYDSVFITGSAGAVVSTPIVGPSNSTVLAYFGQSDGVSPESGLVSSGNTLFGATNSGGLDNDGVIFSIPVGGGTPTVLGSFNGSNGANPGGALVLSGNTLYGTTSSGGDNNDGTVFSLPITGGTPNVLASFDGSNGMNPADGVTLSGNTLYGTAPIGGPYSNSGVFFSLPITGGIPAVLASFSSGVPVGGLILSGNTFYGTTFEGGTASGGSVFEITGAMATPFIAVNAPSNQTATAGTAASFSLGSFSETNATAPFSIDVDWGDGSADTIFSQAAAGTINPQSHIFANGGPDVISVTVADALNLQSNTASFNVSVTAQVTTASISGIEYEDANDTGVYGPGDVTVARLQVYIDTNNNGVLDPGELVASTDIYGNYLFSNLQPGTYVLRPVLITNWIQTEPAGGAARAITLTAGENLTGQDFGEGIPEVGSLGGTVFSDTNANGMQDISESGIAGVSVYLDLNSNGILDTNEPVSVTNASGAFSFTNISAGTYELREITPAGYKLGSPAAGYASVMVTTQQATTGVLLADVPVVTASTKLSGSVIGTSGSYQNDGNTAAKAFDGNLSTFFDGPTSNGNWAGLNLGSGYVISSISYASRSGWASRMNGGVFQGSNSSTFTSGVVNLYTIASNASPSSTVLTTQSVNNSAAFQYVRYLSPNGSYGDVSEVQFFGTPAVAVPPTNPVTPPSTALTGTAIGTSGSYQNDGNTIAKALDGNLATYFDGPSANGNWVGLDLGSAKIITSIAYASRSGWASRMNGGIFQASNSSTFASGVVNLYTIASNANPSSTSLTTQTISNTTAYRYVRYLGPNGSYGDVAEVQFFGSTPTSTPTLTKFTGTTIGTSGSYQNDGNTIAKAVDGNLSTFFDASAANGNWVGLDLGTAQIVKQISFAPRSGYPSRMVGGIFQASNSANFSTGVVNLYTIATAPAASVLTSVSINITTAYRYYRYLSPNGSYGDVAEVGFYG